MFAYTEAVRLCYEQKCGKTQELIQLIGKNNFDIMCSTGLLKQGVERQEGNNISTWAATTALEKEYRFYNEFLSEEEIAVLEQFEALFV